jgi:Fe-S-cluster-containing hydrogenase component 2
MGDRSGQVGRPLLTLRSELCVGCTHCLRVCPTEAIRIRQGKAEAMPHRCIHCGECLRVCPWEAWTVRVEPGEPTGQKEGTLGILDPAVFGQFGDRDPASVLEAFSEIGFSGAREMGVGLALYCQAARRFMACGKAVPPVISSDCPAVVHLVQVKFPSLLENLLPVAPPYEIMAQRLKKELEGKPSSNLGYVVPCLAKAEAAIGSITAEGAYHRVIPVVDLYNPLRGFLLRKEEGIPSRKIPSNLAVEWAFPGGQSKALGIDLPLIVDGIHQVAEVLELAENGLLEEVPFIEAWACAGGCLGGSLNVRNPFWARFQLSSRVRKNRPRSEESPGGSPKAEESDAYLLNQPFSPRGGMRLDENLQAAMEKLRRIDEVVKRFPGIDCGACGCPTCLALAEDVVQGYSLETDCLYVLKGITPPGTGIRKETSWGRPPKSKGQRR